MNWLKRFMMGRYGFDQLSMALVIFSFILTITANLLNLQILVFLSYVPLGISVFRILSRDTSKRSMENYKFSILKNHVSSWFNKKKNYVRDIKTHRYFKCKNCKTKLRIPKGRGRVIVTCPKCKTEFIKKT
jgi:hypothetical protein